ncbi:uncharacterized protein LOC125756213 [Rhipicephalus sanguineus]|uniref:uncharacterized protein LOC125756213 n=1 Tax=Rhipicephalus sanguineus TaxID=34632 RepID=UPI0020C315FB|nr:uncharacterized protein LOC125756213 [Rhipicephalus sanguineus]
MWVTFYLTQRDGEPLIAGYELDGENFVAAPEEMTTPGRIESIATIAKEPISDVIARGTVKFLDGRVFLQTGKVLRPALVTIGRPQSPETDSNTSESQMSEKHAEGVPK